MKFASREDAGRRLGRHLLEQGVEADLMLGLPRGGVVVAAEVARILQRPLDVLIVRKIGHPAHREFAVGALAEPDVVIFDEASLREFPVARAQLDGVVEERARLRRVSVAVSSFDRASAGGAKRCCSWTMDWPRAPRPRRGCFPPDDKARGG